MKKKVFIGYIYGCEFNNVFYWQDDEWLNINEDCEPFKHKRAENEEDKFCGCGGKHPMQKVKITIETIPTKRKKEA